MVKRLLISTLFLLLAIEAKAWVVIDGGDKSIECVGQHCYLEENDDEVTTEVEKTKSKTTYSKDPLAMPKEGGKQNKNDPMAM